MCVSLSVTSLHALAMWLVAWLDVRAPSNASESAQQQSLRRPVRPLLSGLALRSSEGKFLNPFPAKVIKIGPGARLSRDRLPCDSPIEATTPF